jgi:hypothetical protein
MNDSTSLICEPIKQKTSLVNAVSASRRPINQVTVQVLFGSNLKVVEHIACRLLTLTKGSRKLSFEVYHTLSMNCELSVAILKRYDRDENLLNRSQPLGRGCGFATEINSHD